MLNKTRKDLFTHVNANWTETSIFFQGQDTENQLTHGQDDWIYVSINHPKQSKQSSLGGKPLFSRLGELLIKIFTRKKNGSGRLYTLMDLCETMVRNKHIGASVFSAPGSKRDEDESGWLVGITTGYFTTYTEHQIN